MDIKKEENSQNSTTSLNAGHRKRIRTRFVNNGLESFQDYEAIELLLLYVSRQKDMKPLAKKLVESFGSFRGVLDASTEDLKSIDGINEGAITLIHFVKQAAARYLEQTSRINITQQDVNELIKSCSIKMGSLSDEQFRMVSLNANFKVVGEDIIAEGTIDQTAVYPRKIIELAIKRGATTLIFFHNHPSGDFTPSEMDKTITQGLVLATKLVNINVFDHIVLSKNGYFSFREHSLL